MAKTSPPARSRSSRTGTSRRPPARRLTGVERAERYAAGVLSGTIPACKWVRLAVERQQRDLKRKRWLYRFDVAAANRVVDFVEAMPHIKGRKFAGQRIELADWQCFILTTVFGWLHACGEKAGDRRFRIAYIECPRKNGKSTLSAPVALYLAFADGEPGAEVYSAATTKDQAKIVWDDAYRMAVKAADFRAVLGVETSLNSIFSRDTASSVKALSREQQGNLDGLNVHGAIIDELHSHKDRGVWDVLDTATGSRTQPLIWAITTAGFNRAGICYEQHSYVRKIIEGVHEDDTYFGIIYSIDEKDDPFDPASWAKANPNFGVSVEPDDIARKANKARQMAAAQNNFLTKHLNVWVNADTAWMTMRAWDACADTSLDIDDFAGDECVLAADLATKTDLAARIRLFWRDYPALEPDPEAGIEVGGVVRHYYVFPAFYLPEEAAEDGRSQHYAGWATEGRIKLTDGNVTDFGVIEDDIKEDAGRYRVTSAAFDPWQAAQMMQNLQAERLDVVEYRQTVQNMSAPMKELEALVLSGRLHHPGCPVLTWNVSNVVCHTDAKENIYPRKERPENKIDGVIALIMALGRAMVPGESSEMSQGFVQL